MKRISILFFCLTLLLVSISAQRKMETLDRGLIAVKNSEGVFVSWRLFGDEWYGTTYNIYKDGTKLNSEPLEVSNYMDASGTLTSNYTVAAIVDGVEQTQCDAVQPLANQYLEISMVDRPDGYLINDGTAADLDGDGEYEIIVKRICQDWSVDATQFAYFEAYKLDGTLMWEINVGPNIMSSSSVEINIAAFDFDEDGKAEVFLRTSEGTIFGDGTKIGDTDGDGTTNYRYSVLQSDNMRYMNAGPEFLSLVDGETGVELDRVDYIPRGSSEDWGDGYGHRANKFFFGAPYLDGKKPSLFISRGIYTKIVMRAYDVVDKKLVSKWEFRSEDNPGYGYQGNHNYTIADVDEDGRDEIVYGGMTVDDDGTGLYTTQQGHGDALHVGDLDPYRKGTEVWRCLENSPAYGTSLVDGATGEILIHDILGKDCGRCMAANVSDDVDGAALWGSTTIFSAATREAIGLSHLSSNFRIFWDGDLLDELLTNKDNAGDGVAIIHKANVGTLLEAFGTKTNNWTKGTPTLQADLFGDWREEVIWRTTDDTKIRIYTTVDLTPYRNYTLMHDHQYRQAICWQMCGYNQPPHVSYFLGEREGITLPPPPMITNGRMVYNGNGTWDKTSSDWLQDDESVVYADGEHVHFDVLNGEDVSLTLNETVSPSNVTVNSPGDYTIDASSGTLSGAMKLIKQGLGTFTLNGTHDFTGATELWNGRFIFDGTLSNSPVWMSRFAQMEATGSLVKGVVMEYGTSLYVGGENSFANLNITDSISVATASELVFDLHSTTDTQNDTLKISGDLMLENDVDIRVVPHLADGEERLAPGSYVIATVTGEINCDLEQINITGILGTPAELEIQEGSLILVIKEMRDAGSVVWSGANSDVWDLASSVNFLNGEVQDVFVSGDNVEINDDAVVKDIVISEEISPASVVVSGESDFSFSGEGSISGATTLTKSGVGTLTMSNNNGLTGKVTINEGTISVPTLPNAIAGESPLGPVSTSASLFEINGGELEVTSETSMERALYVGSNGASFRNTNTVNWNSVISGGEFTKAGSGEMVLGAVNTIDQMVIKGGSVRLLNEEAYPADVVSLQNGTLVCYDNSYTYSSANYAVNVPEGKTGNMYLDGRCYYKGALTGAGTLNVYIPYVRSDFNGNWSAFEGIINIQSTSGGDVPCRFNNSYGYANATVDIGTGVYAEHLSGGTVKIGALTGLGTMGNATWELGGKNEDFVFRGTFTSGSIKKVGTGTMYLMGASTNSGTTNIYGGTLIATNLSGSATGTGNIYVRDGGSLGGAGTVTGNILVQSGGTLLAGYPTRIGSSFNVKAVSMYDGSIFYVKTNGASNSCDKIKVTNTFTANGQLEIENRSTTEYSEGRSYTIISSPIIYGTFDSISPETPGEGLMWDTSELYTSGIIKVVGATAIGAKPKVEELNLFPNPTEGSVFVDVSSEVGEAVVEVLAPNGKVVKKLISNDEDQLEIDLSDLSTGVYVVRVVFESKLLVGKVILK